MDSSENIRENPENLSMPFDAESLSGEQQAQARSGRLLNKRHLSHRGPSESTAVVPSTPPARQQVRATAEQVGRIFSTIFSTIFRDIFNVTSTETWSEEEIPWQPGTRPVAPSEFRRRAIVNELPSLKTQMSRSEKTCEPDCVPCLKSLSAPHFR